MSHFKELQVAADTICSILTSLGAHLKKNAVPGHFETEASAAQIINQAVQTGILIEILGALEDLKSAEAASGVSDAFRDFAVKNAGGAVADLKKVLD